ncbi:MAG TPA: hypothetical protein VGJ32_09135 [Solirubrobacteraceae bacterium]|jgi:hypothetical protein
MSNALRTPTAVAAEAVADYGRKGFDVLVAFPITNYAEGHGAILAVVDIDGTAYAVEVFGSERPREFHHAETGAEAGRLAIELAGWSA